MTEQQIDSLVARSAAGEGVEAILKSMGLDSNIAIAEIRKHPSAGTRLLEAKAQQRVRRQEQAEAVKQVVE